MTRKQTKFRQISCKIQLQGCLLAASVSYPSTIERTSSKRGAITHFSKRSRHRMLKMMATLKTDDLRATFMTLTYPYLEVDKKRAKGHLRAFIKAIYALPYTPAKIGGVVWRMEIQERGAVHFHLIFTKAPFLKLEDVDRCWLTAINCLGQHVNINVQEITRKKRLMYYVAKYVAKLEPQESTSNISSVPYLAGEEFARTRKSKPVFQGRVWGVEFRALIQWEEAYWFTVRGSVATVTQLKLVALKVWDGIDVTGGKGFSLFIESAGAWYAVVKQILSREREYLCSTTCKSTV